MEFLFPVLLAMLAVFMFMSMRKQKKRMSEMQEMQDSVQTGTRIQLTSGLFGTVIDASSSDVIDVEIATAAAWHHLGLTPPAGALNASFGVRPRDMETGSLFDDL